MDKKKCKPMSTVGQVELTLFDPFFVTGQPNLSRIIHFLLLLFIYLFSLFFLFFFFMAHIDN